MKSNSRFKRFANKYWLALLAVLIAGCARIPPGSLGSFEPTDLNDKVQSGSYVPKVDNFILLMDTSSSMGGAYKGSQFSGEPKVAVEREIASRLNQTIPDISVNGAMRQFGLGSCNHWERTRLVVPMAPYSQAGIGGGIDAIDCAAGGTPVGDALLSIEDDMQAAGGRTAVILFSDGHRENATPAYYVQQLKNQFGDNFCLHTVALGHRDYEIASMKELAEISGCGQAVTADQIAGAQGMEDFVVGAFLTDALDSDGDGIPDPLDNCPDTPAGTDVDSNGCAAVAMDGDSDGDGIPDSEDQCPGTPQGVSVNDAGCWELEIRFDFDQAVIKPVYYAELDEVVTVLQNQSDSRIQVAGHTDSLGNAEYNRSLSLRRAQAVKDYLVEQGIAEDRLEAEGFGGEQPIASNDTREGRSENRRVELRQMN